MSVAEGLTDAGWIRGINPNLSIEGIQQFLHLCEALGSVALGEEDDCLRWSWSGTSKYTQEPGTIDHLLIGCVVTRQIWWKILCAWGAIQWLLDARSSLAEWWGNVHLHGSSRKNLATAATLVFWMIWKHRNAIVFDGETSGIDKILRAIQVEGAAWKNAGLLTDKFSFFPGPDSVGVEWTGVG
ncbi:hypothetical protein BRADI_3g21782v3 [Brachypodium distachyon]|uniref:Reverse transcriptase zinc-binding domain-containing protein n=1 Tax=Brachypodium distachyon TaxID=15368 RepID=A0A0Q3FDG4_BRADI|nr:hypothetical protein BRADI_3g21782v3 [Brachypodium distachyon]